ncbi:MAG: hypothetical protein ACD_48C00395G0001 [uncultured bacterium]|nr:MAG: hypothetical protein ACD_48C00395G0001 [uncultured bacterium]
MIHFNPQEQAAVARTGFIVSLTSYSLFWLCDILRPGFVARFFSVHLFLLGVILFGIWWGATVEEYTDLPRVQHIFLFLSGIFAAAITWNLGDVFGGWRFLVSVVALVAPVLVLRLVKYK